MDELMFIEALENLENAEHNLHFNNQRNPQDPFIVFNERQFINMFRLSKELCRFLLEQVEPFMRPKIRPTDLDVTTRVLIALSFMARGCYQPNVGANKFFDVSQSTVSRSLHEVIEVLCRPEIFREWVKFPQNFEELNRVRSRFFEIHNFPGIVGCIDCTHVAIFPPKIDDPNHPEYLYVNRKQHHSINVQLVCDADLKILDANARYPGSTHDAYIWGQSSVQRLMRDLHDRDHTDYYLLGDSGYPLRQWLLTPLNDDGIVPDTPEHRYNVAHKRTRSTIERCNGVLKGRFRCLLKHRVLHYRPDVACRIINACCVLHNMCIHYNVPEADNENEDIGGIDFGILGDVQGNIHDNALQRINPELVAGRRARSKVVNYFARNL